MSIRSHCSSILLTNRDFSRNSAELKEFWGQDRAEREDCDMKALGSISGTLRSQRPCRPWFAECAGVVLVGCCDKSEVERHKRVEKRDKNVHGEVVKHFNTCLLVRNSAESQIATIGLLAV
ncbi:unnamed protein product [Porites evermanni]|uniref:Uncharacterized protein n=1 Tax=Porites evermanni TaxID=104178 RepID=A0ABN8M6C1_9CNID|nr:unnamed protein product [Porites evermanni]